MDSSLAVAVPSCHAENPEACICDIGPPTVYHLDSTTDVMFEGGIVREVGSP